jgi:DNA helicase II / ATP-dependent DNA helicase PcrA
VPQLLEGLTTAQAEAVEHPRGPLLVIAGAGTGKTRTLAARFARLVGEGIAPESILALTFSNAAAEELRCRLENAIDRPYEELAVHTVHGFCAALLRREALEAGLDPFAVPATTADRLALLLDHLDQLTFTHHDFRGRPAALLASFLERIDRLKDELVTAEDYAAWAQTLEEDEDAPAGRAAREREFARLYADHDRLLSQAGTLDFGDLVLNAVNLLRSRPSVLARVRERHPHVLVDEFQDTNHAQRELIDLLNNPDGSLTVVGDDDQAIYRFRGASTKNLRDFAAAHPDARLVNLEQSFRCPQRILDVAGAVVQGNADRIGKTLRGREGGQVEFWRAANERAQGQAAAADIERLVGREGVSPDEIAVLVRSVRSEGQPLAVALEERAVPFRLVGAASFFQRAEVRDVLAWLRLLTDPGDAGAVVRALARPPIELRSIDLARCIQIARRRKLDMVSALVAATESPQLPPEARERILAFLKLHRSAVGALDTTRPDLFVHRLIERLGLRRQQLFAAQVDVVERLVNLARLADLATAYVRRSPQATPREFARYLAAVADAGMREEEDATAQHAPAVSVMTMHAAKGLEFAHVYVLGLQSTRMPGARREHVEPIPDVLLSENVPPDSRAAHVAEMRRLLHVAMTRASERLVLAYAASSERGGPQQPSPFVEEARAALGAEWQDREEELFGPAESLHATFRMMRDELLDTVTRAGNRLGELRFDTDLDISHAVVRLLELVKLSALLQRRPGQSVEEALSDVNSRLFQAATAEQREILVTSGLDDLLLSAERDDRVRTRAVAARDEPSLEAFLPRRGDGLVLSASDIETYRTCPLKYKFARVFRIPQEPTINQRFGIVVHQVLERFHAGTGKSLDDLHELLDAAWRRGGLRLGEEERQLREKARNALTLYHRRFEAEESEPVWFERAFSFKLGPHLLRGRVDRVDRLPDGDYELIDYKTGRPKSPSELREDIQLSLYAVGAREAWQLESSRQAYHYVLDDVKVPVERDDADREWITETVMTVADGVLAQDFEPTPSYAACSVCDYRIVCPAAEK